jgi:hypothetical protein
VPQGAQPAMGIEQGAAGQTANDLRLGGWPGAGSNRRPSDFQSERSCRSELVSEPFVRSACNTTLSVIDASKQTDLLESVVEHEEGFEGYCNVTDEVPAGAEVAQPRLVRGSVQGVAGSEKLHRSLPPELDLLSSPRSWLREAA